MIWAAGFWRRGGGRAAGERAGDSGAGATGWRSWTGGREGGPSPLPDGSRRHCRGAAPGHADAVAATTRSVTQRNSATRDVNGAVALRRRDDQGLGAVDSGRGREGGLSGVPGAGGGSCLWLLVGSAEDVLRSGAPGTGETLWAGC